MKNKKQLFILYACAGCSKAGQNAYQIAIELDSRKAGEMSCLAGVASGKSSFIKKITAKKIAVIDGCPIECAKTVLKNCGLQIDAHFQLRSFGISKNKATTQKQIEVVVNQIEQQLKESEIMQIN